MFYFCIFNNKLDLFEATCFIIVNLLSTHWIWHHNGAPLWFGSYIVNIILGRKIFKAKNTLAYFNEHSSALNTTSLIKKGKIICKKTQTFLWFFQNGALTISITTFTIATHSITIKMWFSVFDTQYNIKKWNFEQTIMLSSFMLSIAFKNVKLSVFMLNVVKLSVIMLKSTAPIKHVNFFIEFWRSNFDTLISKTTHIITLKNAALSRQKCLNHLCSVLYLRTSSWVFLSWMSLSWMSVCWKPWHL